MSDFQGYELGDLVTVFDGPHATPKRQSQGPYFLNIASLVDGRLDLSLSDHVTAEDFEKWTRRVTPEAGDLLFSYETRLGDAALMPAGIHACLGRRMGLLRPDRSLIDPQFLLYYYLGPTFQRIIEVNTIHGATVNRIPLINMGKWQVRIPELRDQKAIAEVLGALDDKIAANTKLAATADELGGQMYDVSVSSWPQVPMSELLVPILGGTPSRSKEEFWSPATDLWISARDITAAPNRVVLDTVEKISSLATTATKAKPLPAGSVILTARGTVGAVGRLAQPAAFNQSCYGFSPGVVPAEVLFYSVVRAAEYAKKIAHGSVFDTITKATFDHLAMAWDPNAVNDLDMQLAPVHRRIDAALAENRTLAATRDALLPQLMSGKIRVRDAEKLASEAGA